MELFDHTTASFKESLRNIIKEGRVYFRDEGEMDSSEFLDMGTDRTKLPADFQILVQPGNTDEVAGVVKLANVSGLSIVPSGGRTGYAGGAVARNNEIVLSLKRMNRVLGFDPLLSVLHVEAGMITKHLQEYSENLGYYFPVDFASAGSSTVGGNIATNAGGIHVIRYGQMRKWVAGLTVVTGNGEKIISRHDVVKNNTGYDLNQLMIGSEGTLGIITESAVKLCSPPQDTEVLICSFTSFSYVLKLFDEAVRGGVLIHAFEYFDGASLSCVMKKMNLKDLFPERYSFYVLLEMEKNNRSVRFIETILERDDTVVRDAVHAKSLSEIKSLWMYREMISESISDRILYKADISIPLRGMEDFLRSVQERVDEEKGISAVTFGHVGDGNIHLNLLAEPGLSKEEFYKKCTTLEPFIYDMTDHLGGSVSAEHGIGLLKSHLLHYTRSPEEIRIMKGIKRAFDPNGVLNPGKILG